MCEVKRYFVYWNYQIYSENKDGDIVMAVDFDRVTAERDAALADLASANSDREAYAQNAIDLRKRVEALQQRLTAADERADVLEGLVREALEGLSSVKMLGLRKRIRAALKPAEGGGDA